MLSAPGLSFFVKTFGCIWCCDALKLHDYTSHNGWDSLATVPATLRIDEPYSFGHLSTNCSSSFQECQTDKSEQTQQYLDVWRWCLGGEVVHSQVGPGGGLGIWDLFTYLVPHQERREPGTLRSLSSDFVDFSGFRSWGTLILKDLSTSQFPKAQSHSVTAQVRHLVGSMALVLTDLTDFDSFQAVCSLLRRLNCMGATGYHGVLLEALYSAAPCDFQLEMIITTIIH